MSVRTIARACLGVALLGLAALKLMSGASDDVAKSLNVVVAGATAAEVGIGLAVFAFPRSRFAAVTAAAFALSLALVAGLALVFDPGSLSSCGCFGARSAT